ncbi:CCA tRNA nucleotidyltransferase [Sporosarcina ureilytica]|uniref:CCA-adding enzyme n=1 Tax=Sporosarcina ureilytica TaxID=298596 RepID=A0A1D8JH58_9BACL|nr:CCA tRNA nucleotidyltransferase [Sporosarcina ureilytica]AOV08049.1 hypothetical protein BI350_11225 [Sporosarcina ureilytica]
MIQPFGTPASYLVLEKLEQHGHEAVFVGGAVRDYLLGKRATDIDIATSAEPNEVKAIFSNTIDVGIAHGTVLVLLNHEPIEVTTFRTEGTYSDARRPDEVQFVKTLHEDLLRRDFTFNALAMTKDGQLIDLFNGQEDLKHKIIRAVGVPEERFHEDALRMMRALRFASVLDFTLDPATFEAIRNQAERLGNVSVERIKIEMDRLFLGTNPLAAFKLFTETKLSQALPLFPKETRGLEHALPFASANEGWAYLLVAGEYSASTLGGAYKLSNDEKRFIAAVETAYTIRKEHPFAMDEIYLFDVPVLEAAEKFYRSISMDEGFAPFPQFEKEKNKLAIQSPRDLSVNGRDLMNWADVKGGRWTGEWMKKIEAAVLHGRCVNDPNKIREWFMNDFNSKE